MVTQVPRSDLTTLPSYSSQRVLGGARLASKLLKYTSVGQEPHCDYISTQAQAGLPSSNREAHRAEATYPAFPFYAGNAKLPAGNYKVV